MFKQIFGDHWDFIVPSIGMRYATVACVLACVVGQVLAVQGVDVSSSLRELKQLSIEALMNVDVSTATRQQERLIKTPSAVYVITRDDIRRSGVTSIPEALRLAPGVEVARAGAQSWAISIRGFNSDLANKLLVLIDGRSVYSPLYAGVFWDVQEILLEDVERIEVVAGPGGTLWGANAVNGVINIITRSAEDTQGGFAQIGGGNEERGFGGFRYGGQLGENIAARVYVKALNRDSPKLIAGGDAVDDWQMAQGGFRLDWKPTSSDSITWQGDIYAGRKDGQFPSSFTLGTLPGPNFEDHLYVAGGNLRGRWFRELGERSDLKLQMYYDRTRRDIPGIYNETRDTLDVDFQHHFSLGNRHDVLWGLGFRLTTDELDNTMYAMFIPDSRTDLTFSAFLQDRIELWRKRLFLTLGSKFEHNDYTGFEVQPSARLAWLVSARQTVWAAISRAVRIPSRLGADLQFTNPVSVPDIPFPVYVNVKGSDDFDSEKLLAYEVGYRLQVSDALSFDLAAFYNEYDDLQTIEPEEPIFVTMPPYIILPNTLSNGMTGESYGGTLVANWQPVSQWRLQFQYTRFHLELRNKPGSVGASSQDAGGNSPENQLSLHSFLDLPYNLSLYTGVRYVDDLPNQDISSYTALDISLGWKPSKSLEMAITGRNLTDDRHPEFGGGIEIERSIYGTMTWRF